MEKSDLILCEPFLSFRSAITVVAILKILLFIDAAFSLWITEILLIQSLPTIHVQCVCVFVVIKYA